MRSGSIGTASTSSSSGPGWTSSSSTAATIRRPNVTGDDPIVTGKIALAHMKEFPDYYERLERMEAEAKRDWANRG